MFALRDTLNLVVFPHLAFPREMQSKRLYLGNKAQNSRDSDCPHLILPSIDMGSACRVCGDYLSPAGLGSDYRCPQLKRFERPR